MKNTRITTFTAILLSLTFAFITNASARECEHIVPKVNVKIDTGQVVYDFARDRKYISDIFNKDRGRSGLSHHTAGLTAAIFKSQVTGTVKLTSKGRNLRHRFSTSKRKNICVQLEQVDVYMGYGDIVVYVDNNYQRGSCMFDAILRHENTHVNIYQTFLAHYADYLKKSVEYVAKKQAPVWVGSTKEAEQVRNRMVEGVLRGIQPAIQHYANARDDENQKLDSTENYAYTQEQCEAW